MDIRLLAAGDVDVLMALRRKGLIEIPLAFGASPETDFAGDRGAVLAYLGSAPERILLGAFDEGGVLVGMAGMGRGRHGKGRHRAEIWGMYVDPAARGQGAGRRLLQGLRDSAKSQGVEWLDLAVSSNMPAARHLYESFGFVLWGTHPDGLRHEGQRTEELHMSLGV